MPNSQGSRAGNDFIIPRYPFSLAHRSPQDEDWSRSLVIPKKSPVMVCSLTTQPAWRAISIFTRRAKADGSLILEPSAIIA